jgi:hypothetical protein
MIAVNHTLHRGALALLPLLLAACVTTDYLGKSYAPTHHVELYYDEADITVPYEVMGEVRAEVDNALFFSSSEKMQRKLIDIAREKGADALLVGRVALRPRGETEYGSEETTYKKGQGRSSSTTTTVVDEVKEIRAQLLKYRPENAAAAPASR